jgi:hypothetical protein
VSRDYGWRDGCEAAGVTAMVVGSSAWFGSVVLVARVAVLGR